MPDETKSVENLTPIVETPAQHPPAPPNFTRTPEEAKKESAEIDVKEKEEKKKELCTMIKNVLLIPGVAGLICCIAILSLLFYTRSSVESLRKNQISLGTVIEEYVKANTDVIKQIDQNCKTALESTSSYEARLKNLEEKSLDVAAITAAVTKVNKLAIMNRNRLYRILIKDDPAIENAFVEEKLDGDVIQKNTEDLVLAMSKAIEKKNDDKAKKDAAILEEAEKTKELEVVKEPETVIKPEVVKEPEAVKEPVKAKKTPAIKAKKVTPDVKKASAKKTPVKKAVKAKHEVKPKKDHLLILKPWKWSWLQPAEEAEEK